MGDTKTYLGDGVYADFDRWPGGKAAVILTTEDGYSATNRIVLEPEVLAALFQYVRRHAVEPAPACARCREEEHDQCGGVESGCGCAFRNHE